MDLSAGNALYELLPIPSIYLNADGGIEQANAAARKIILAHSFQHNLNGVSIFETNFVSDYLDNDSTLKDALNQLLHESKKNRRDSFKVSADQQAWNGEASVNGSGAVQEFKSRQKRIRDEETAEQFSLLLRSSRACSLQWHVTILRVSGIILFSLTGSPKTSWKDSYLPKEEEFDFLLSLAEPTFKNVPHYVNIMHADTKTLKVNTGAVNIQPRLAEAFSKKLPIGLWDDAFTTPLSLSDGVGAVSLRQRQGNVTATRGIEDPDTGMRTVHDCTTTVLRSPFTDSMLGVVVQVREALEYSDWIQRLDVLDCRNAALAEGKFPIMVRTMLNSREIDYFSNSWESFTGISRKQLLQDWHSLFHHEDLLSLGKKIDSCMHTGLSCEYQIRIRKDTQWHYFKERFAPLKQNGKIIRWYFISTDIKDLVDERDAALQATDRLYRIINSMNIIIFEVDDTWTVSQAEGALKVITEDGQAMVAANYPGNSLYDICSVIRPGGIQELMDELIKVMDGQEGKVVVDYKLGQQWLRTIAIPGVDSSLNAGKRLFGITLDRSAEHASENAKLQLQTMQETERLKSQFLANISHELRTPISGLIGILELLKDTPLSETQLDYVSTLESSSQSLLVIVNDILDLSKAEAVHVSISKVPFNLEDILNDLCKSNGILAANKGLVLNYQPPNLSQTLLGDPGRIRQILQNILGNAIKFTLSGSITLRSTCVTTDKTSQLKIEILDTGIGIDDDTMAVLFRPFVQADQSTTRVYGGTGLGLSIARKFARLMGGDVILESAKDKGTRAIINLELELAPSHDATMNDGSIVPGAFDGAMDLYSSKRHVLVVEDNKINEKVIRFHLNRLGFKHVVSACNGAEAVAYVKTAAEQDDGGANIPDVILMDCQMPVLDGYKATQILRTELGFDRPIIALTASAIQGDREKCIAAGMDDHIAKPVSQKMLDQIFKKWLVNRVHTPP